MAKNWREELVKKYYSGARSLDDQWPGLVRRYTPRRGKVLEIGGGPVDWTSGMLRECAQEIVGLDVDPLVRDNHLIDKALVYDGGRFPLPDGYFDLAISRWVNEHLEDPCGHFREVQRILAPGGLYVFRTVNLFHYKTLGTCLVPQRLQMPLARWLRHMSPQEHDPYPTYFRANTKRRIRRLCQEVGLTPVSFEMSEDYPFYGMAFKGLFYTLMIHERLVNSSARFEGLRHTIDCVARRADGVGRDDAALVSSSRGRNGPVAAIYRP